MRVFLEKMNAFLWGAPALVLILTVGLFLSIRLRFAQLILLPQAMKRFCSGLKPGGKNSSFRAVCTALAATVGTGNLAGVAGAICLGGPGAIFWMWLCGILGMVTKYAEAVLSVRYRIQNQEGFQGGPMYVMEQGLGKRTMAVCYSLFGLAASFGVGNAAQINTVVTSIHGLTDGDFFWNILIGILLAGIIGTLLLGGAKRVGKAAEQLVPLAAAGYILLCIGVLVLRITEIPRAISQIFLGAFSPRAATGGLLGSGFQALRVGCSRGVFTNEAGMGTAGMAHGGADVEHPAQQGLMGIVEVFLDTVVICTLTALVILTSGVNIPYGVDAGAELTQRAFHSVYGPVSSVFLSMAVSLFAVAAVLGWGVYGGRCAQYLFGQKVWKIYALAQTMMVMAGAVLDTGLVWQFSEVLNGLMVIPNLLTLAILTPEVSRLTMEYKKIG